jgi:hypothetical protein
MTDFDLLRAVQPDDGWFVVVSLKGSGNEVQRRQDFLSTREEVDVLAERRSKSGWNVFFGVAKYATDQNRTKENVQGLKAFWLDIDCGETKAQPNAKTGRPEGYIDQATGLAALQRFCRTVGLPRPIIVNSGRGVHAYWALTGTITREQWEPVAERLRKLCTTHELYVDNAVFEVARILRIPGTLNYKDDPPREVTVLATGQPVDFEKFYSILGVKAAEILPLETPKRELSELAKSLQENITSSFAKILQRSTEGNGCQQILDCYENRVSLAENRWFSALSVAKFCADQDTAIHIMSEGHPDYDPHKTLQKIKHIVGPHTCETFERGNPGGCDGCPFAGKIKSPITLGNEVIAATEEDNVVVEEPEEEGFAPKTHVIPEYPFPFFRGKAGGIYRKSPLGRDGKPIEEGDILVLPYDFYILKRMRDPIEKDVAVFKFHTPQDGVREFTAPLAKISELGDLRKLLAGESILCGKKRFEYLAEYIRASLTALTDKRKAELMRLQFGWADNDSKFIVGDSEITAEGTFYSPPSSITGLIAERMGPVGSLDKWKEVFNLYGRPGLEPHAFAALTGFGAPVFKFLGQRGAMLNVIHPHSGTGKTTILHMCNSIWGSPDGLCCVQEDTLNAKIMRLGIYNNLPYTVDEMTNMTSAEFSVLAYNITQGRGKDRVKASSNELRHNATTWQTMALCSSNASFYEKMGVAKNSPDGELMRLVEYKIDYTDTLDPLMAKNMFDHQLMENNGHAGRIYAAWLVANYELAKKTALNTQAKLDRELKLTQRERFWSAVLAANLTGGAIAKHIGLIDWDMPSIYDWACKLLLSLRDDVQPPRNNAIEVVGDYIRRNIQSILVVNEEADARSSMLAAPILEPRNELLIRWEPDTQKMYIATVPFKRDCAQFQINYKETMDYLSKRGVLTGKIVKRLSKGMKMVAPPVYCLEFNTASEEFFSVGDVVGVGSTDAS